VCAGIYPFALQPLDAPDAEPSASKPEGIKTPLMLPNPVEVQLI